MEHFGHKFKKIDQLFKFRMNKNLEALDITFAQMHVLIYLEHHIGEKVTQKRLSEEFDVKHSTMAGILQRMQEKGLITITVDEDNKKYKNIVRTKKAENIQLKSNEHRDQTEAALLRGFSEEEKKALSNFLDRVYDNLKSDDAIIDTCKKDLEGELK